MSSVDMKTSNYRRTRDFRCDWVIATTVTPTVLGSRLPPGFLPEHLIRTRLLEMCHR